MHRYALALGANRMSGHGPPAATLRAAITALGGVGRVAAVSRILRTAPHGPAGRSFANAAAILETGLGPPALLDALKAIERRFGRRGGRRWGARVLDLDILLWSGGRWPGGLRRASPHGLAVPHRALAGRTFVLDPLAAIAPGWRVPPGGATVRQLRARLTRARPAPRSRTAVGL